MKNKIIDRISFRKFQVLVFFLLLISVLSSKAQTVYNPSPDPTVCAGKNVTFAYSGGCTSISWQLDPGGTIVSSTSTTVTAKWNSPTSLASVTARCNTNLSLTATTGNFTVSSNSTPSVSITGPTNICIGSLVTYQAQPVNGGAPSYAWKINGVTQQNSPSSSFSTALLNQGDQVSVQMSSNLSCISPSIAVTSNVIAISSATQPSDVSVSIPQPPVLCPGQSMSFTAATENGGSNPIYVWYRNGSVATDNESSGDTYTPHYELVNGDKIKCQVTSNASCISNNTAMSNEITLTALVIPSVTISPDAYSFCDGGSVSFTANANYPIAGYNWRVGNSAVLSTSPTFTLTNQHADISGVKLDVTLNASCAANNSASTTLSSTILVLPVPSVSITGPTNICIGSLVTYQAQPVNGGSAPSYVWKVNSVAKQSSLSSSFSTTLLNQGDQVSVQMTPNSICTTPVTSNVITISVATQPSAVSVSIPQPPLLCPGQIMTFTATTVNGYANSTYIWYRNGSVATDNESSGNTYKPHYTLNAGDKIKCQVSSTTSCISGNPAISNEVTLTAPVIPSAIISADVSSFCDGGSVSFTANANYPITGYNWRVGASAVLSTSSTFTLANQHTDISGVKLDVTLNASCAANNSASTVLTQNVLMRPNPIASITPSAPIKICSTCTQPITATIGSNYTYQWSKDGSSLGGATASSYQANLAGVYGVTVSLNGCMNNSNTLSLTKNIVPVANAGPDKIVTLPSNSIILTGAGSDADGSISSYSWTQIGSTATLSGTTSADLNISDLTYGTYLFSLVVTDDFGEQSVADQVTVTVNYPDNNYNYIRETSILVPNTTLESQIETLSIDQSQKNINTTYFDGLGKVMQSVTTKGSPGKADIVQPVIYDEFGREVIKYLPYVSTENNGWYKVNPVGIAGNYNASNHFAFYNNGLSDKIADDQKPFAVTRFESSPLNRVLEQGAPGSDWQPDLMDSYVSTDRTIKFAYESNAANEVLLWTYTYPTAAFPLGLVNASNAATPVYYPANQLYKTRTKDEHFNEIIEFKDKAGRTILKKVQAPAGAWAQTYYVYDDFDNLVTVLPPEAVKAISKTPTSEYFNQTDAVKETFLLRWAFRYTYDTRRRMSQKQVPGAGPVYMVYDDRDRLVLTQDANQRAGVTGAAKYWSFTKYDELNRPIITGIKDTTTAVQLTRDQMQDVVDTYYSLIATTKPWRRCGEAYIGNVAGNIHGYSNKAYPAVTTGATNTFSSYLTVSYYDSYAFKSTLSGDYGYVNDNLTETRNGIIYTQRASEWPNVIGLTTGSKVRVLDGNVSGGGYTWLTSVNYYDEKYRVIQTVSDNYRGGSDRLTALYDFPGKVLKTKKVHYGLNFKDQVNIQHVANKLSKTITSTAWGDSGAASIEMLPANQDGWVEFIAAAIDKAVIVGFSQANANASWNTIGNGLLLNSGKLEIRESGSANILLPSPTYAVGDVLRIERKQGQIYYYKNGLLLTAPKSITTNALLIDVSMYTNLSQLYSIRSSFGSFNPRRIAERFEYDHAGRLLKTWHQVDSQSEILLSYNQYNELGQLIDKKLHSTNADAIDAKQSIDYRYNIRGWLTSMNNAELAQNASNDDTGDFFGMNLAYNDDLGTGNSSSLQYNGNISGMKWSVNQGYGNLKEMAYNYGYDAMNRLLSASHKQAVTAGTWTTGQYDESGFVYDLNGNINNLTRNGDGGTQIDNLVYNYGAGTTAASNKLLYVQDNATDAVAKVKGFYDGQPGTAIDYTYDANGNMTMDKNKGITTAIAYNYLNLPITVTKGGNYLNYIYDATGRKLAQVQSYTGSYFANEVTYSGEFQYKNEAIQFINHEEGRIVLVNEKNIYTTDGSSITGTPNANGATATAVNQNGNQTYVQVTSNGTTYGGIFPLGGIIPAAPGEVYRIRTKGYRTGTHAVYILASTNLGNITWGSNWFGSALPTLVTTEAWIEETVTIPAGATQLQVGLIWNTTVSGEQFFVNDFEITKLCANSAPEYQYNLKDHLGNVRVTFTTKLDVQTDLATLEAANQASESGKFLRYDRLRLVNSPLFDHTNDASATSGNAIRLSGNANEKTGLEKSLAVMPGDVIQMEVYAKYIDTNSSNWTAALNTLLTGIAAGTAPAGTVIDGASYSTNSTNPFVYTGLNNTGSSTGTGPKAYLNYLVFDKNFNPIIAQSGYQRLSSTPKEAGNNVPHEKLSAQITITEPGYVYVYLSNEELSPLEVYFDDFKVTNTKALVISAQDYYPFGLTFNSYQRENSVKQDYLYNGKENQDELNLGWLDYGARMYMPDIGRFNKNDKASGLFHSISPYSYVGNNPSNAIDPDGNYVLFVNGLTNILGFQIMPSGQGYWGTKTVGLFLKLFNKNQKQDYREFVNGEFKANKHSWASNSHERFKSGQDWAKENYNRIIQAYEAEKETNPAATLNIVSHSQGAAFSEGIAEYISEKSEGAYKVNTMVHLQPSGAGLIPAARETVDTRLAVYTFGDLVANKFGTRMENVDIEIEETRWNRDEIKHTINGGQSLYYKGLYDVNSAHGLNYSRSSEIVNTVIIGISGPSPKRKNPDADKNSSDRSGGG